VSASGESPSRRRIFICSPPPTDGLTCAKKILSAMVRRRTGPRDGLWSLARVVGFYQKSWKRQYV